MELVIDPEFADKIPPLTEEEYQQLEENILSDGRIISPLITWNGIIVDGHNRFRILQKHPEISYTTMEMEFPDRYAAIIWICRNQLGRRNLTELQKKLLIGKRYEAEKARHGFNAQAQTRDAKGHFVRSGQNDHFGEKTRERIAKENNVSDSYVRRAESFSKGVDVADQALPGIKQEIVSGQLKPTAKEIAEIARASPEERKALAEQLRIPRSSSQKQLVLPEEDDKDAVEMVSDSSQKEHNPSLASIQAISDRMASGNNHPRAVVDSEFIIYELEDSLKSMIFRWDTCLNDYRKEASAKDCQKRIKELALEGIRFFQQLKTRRNTK